MSTLERRRATGTNDVGRGVPVKRTSSGGGESKAKKVKTAKSKTRLEDESSTSEGKGKTAKRLKSREEPEKSAATKKVKREAKSPGTKKSAGDKRRRGTKKTDQSVGTGKVEDSRNDSNSVKDSVRVAEFSCSWKDEDCLAEFEKIPVTIAKNMIELLNEENTIPFIARYRSHLTGGLKPDKLRKIRETYEDIQQVHEKAKQLHKQLATAKVLTPELLSCIQTSRTLEELDFIGSRFKKSSKRTLAERARELGLEPAAEAVLTGKEVINLESLVKPDVAELDDVRKVKLGIQHVIADVISKTAEVHSQLAEIYSSNQVFLKSEFKKTNEVDRVVSKYQIYGDFSRPLHAMKPHQTLAISRGEAENELSVKIVIPESLWLPLKRFCKTKWLGSGVKYKLRSSLVEDSVDDAIKRLLGPLAIRRIRSKLNAEAENEALCVFGYNLRQLLMTSPCTGHAVMGIDPGFRNGCKVAVVSHTGSLLGYDRFFLKDPVTARKKLRALISQFKCDVIALGNGTACRETETLLSDFIKKRFFKPVNVSYTIISEQAVSIYSCSPIAAEEFPNLDPTIVGAISLARRLQNPLSELVKVEPKHLGVGMYQHDVGEKKLISTLDEIVSECVSFVGVDVNSASLYLLKRVAGLNTSKAQEIIKYRSEVCTFKRREDLKKVKGIKTKTFMQCAGFLRVVPSTARCTRHVACENKFNPLDETCIHPESYEIAYKIMNLFGVKSEELGSENFVETIASFSFAMETLAQYCECSELTASFIVDTLKKPKNFDLRTLSPGPIFRQEIKKLEELSPGQNLDGVVRNLVSFGAFVDLGVGIDGLIHTSKMGNTVLELNNRVNVEVISVDTVTQRIQLRLINLIEG